MSECVSEFVSECVSECVSEPATSGEGYYLRVVWFGVFGWVRACATACSSTVLGWAGTRRYHSYIVANQLYQAQARALGTSVCSNTTSG